MSDTRRRIFKTKFGYLPCSNATRHKGFKWYVQAYQDYVCCICNWQIGYQGGQDSLDNYPEDMRTALQQALQEVKS